MLRKLQRGAVNVLLSPIEIAVELAKVKNCDTFPPSWALGASRGSFYMIGRIVTGAYEIVTFPFPLPTGYAPILEPEFPWELEGLSVCPAQAKSPPLSSASSIPAAAPTLQKEEETSTPPVSEAETSLPPAQPEPAAPAAEPEPDAPAEFKLEPVAPRPQPSPLYKK